jgi:hypothetical protein
MPDYTIEVYKQDRRLRRGQRLLVKQDHTDGDLEVLKSQYLAQYPDSKGYTVSFHETWVTSYNSQTGLPIRERYDRPYHCSPRSEAYHCT